MKERLTTLTQLLIISFILALIITRVIITPCTVVGQSMEPTLTEGDKLIVSRLNYIFTKPERGDIVVLEDVDSGMILVKRLIGLPNEKIDVIDGEVRINNKVLKEDYIKETDWYTVIESHCQIPEDWYFVMGDNRNHSSDSRTELGLVHKSEIIGKSIINLNDLFRK